MHHDVDVADFLITAHLAGRVIGFVDRLAVGQQVDDVNAHPPLVQRANRVPSVRSNLFAPFQRGNGESFSAPIATAGET